MKAILISIKPKYVAKILNGEKTIEIRKTCPIQLRGDTPVEPEPIDVYIYCTKEEELFYDRNSQKWIVAKKRKNVKRLSNGVVKAKFTLNKVEEITYDSTYKLFKLNDVLQNSCLTEKELFDYLGGKVGYAWHISNLVIFDEPKKLGKFRKIGKHCKYQGRDTYCDYCSHCDCIGDELTKAPQSYMFIEVD